MSDQRPDSRPGELPGAVLFACNHNRVRSPMAEALMKLMFGDRVFVDSCGLRLDDDDDPDPFAVAVMDELGADLSRHRSKTLATWRKGRSTWSSH